METYILDISQFPAYETGLIFVAGKQIVLTVFGKNAALVDVASFICGFGTLIVATFVCDQQGRWDTV